MPNIPGRNPRAVTHCPSRTPTMPNYCRAHVPGGSFFFTVVTYRRRPLFNDALAVPLLGSVLRRCRMRWPFTINAIVLLPDHLHAIWSLPPGDSGYSKRWGWIKKEFTKRWLELGGSEQVVSTGREQQRRRGIWQPRFWEHALEDEEDFQAHFDYIHWNPVKHACVQFPFEWPHSSFHRYVRLGVYERQWGGFADQGQRPPFNIRAIESKAGEPGGSPRWCSEC